MQNPPIINELIAKDPELKSFQEALKNRDFAEIQAHLGRNKKLFYTPDQNGVFPITYAIKNDDVELTKCLLSDVDYITLNDPYNNSLAHFALAYNKKEVFKALIKINPSFLIQENINGKTPILEILKKNDEELFDFIAEDYPEFLFVKDHQNWFLTDHAYTQKKPEFFAKILKKYLLVAQRQSNFENPLDNSFVENVNADFFKNVIDLIDNDELNQILTFKTNNQFSLLDKIILKNRPDLLNLVLEKCSNILDYCDDISIMNSSLEAKNFKKYPEFAIDIVLKKKFGLTPADEDNNKLFRDFFDASNILLLTNNDQSFSNNFLNILPIYSRLNRYRDEKLAEPNEYPKIFELVYELFKNPDLQIKFPNNNKLFVFSSNIQGHASFFLFNLDENNHLTSVTYCDGNKHDQRQIIDEEHDQIYGATTYQLKSPIQYYGAFMKDFLDLNKSPDNFEYFYERGGVLFPNSVEIAETKFSVPTKFQTRGNCSIKSLNILAQFIAEQISLQPVVYEKDDDGKLTCESKRNFKEYKEFLMNCSVDLLESMVENFEEKANRSKLEEFILKHSKEVLRIYDEHQIEKMQREIDRDELEKLREERVVNQDRVDFSNGSGSRSSSVSRSSSSDDYRYLSSDDSFDDGSPILSQSRKKIRLESGGGVDEERSGGVSVGEERRADVSAGEERRADVSAGKEGGGENTASTAPKPKTAEPQSNKIAIENLISPL